MSTDSDTKPFAERVWDTICPFYQYLLVIVILEIVFLSLLTFSLVVGVDSNSATGTILIVDFIIVMPPLIAASYAYRRCKQRERV
ncbi:MAG: hypothetical protein ABEI98_08845 [Halorhabdus sp.]